MKLVLLPGLDGTGSLFEPLVKELPPSIEPVVISYPTDQILDYAQLVNLVIARLPQDEPFVLLGESFSGRVAFEIGTRGIPTLAGVIFVCSFLKSQNLILRGLASALPLGPLVKAGLPVFFVRKFLLGDEASDELIESFWQAVRSVDVKILRHRIKMVMGPNPFTGVNREPVAHIRATRDRLVTRKTTRDLILNCEDGVEQEVVGPHFLLQARPKECADIVWEKVEEWSLRDTLPNSD